MNDPAKDRTVISLESRLIPAWQTRKNIRSEEDAEYEHQENLAAVRDLANELLPFLYLIKGHGEDYRTKNDIERFNKKVRTDVEYLTKKLGAPLRKFVARELYSKLATMTRASPTEVTEQFFMTFKEEHHDRIQASCDAGKITSAESTVYHDAGRDSIEMMVYAYDAIEKKENKTPYGIEKDWMTHGAIVGLFGLFTGGPLLALLTGGPVYALGSRFAQIEHEGKIIDEFRNRFEPARENYIKRLLSVKIRP